MSVSPLERTIEVECGAEDVTVNVVSPRGVTAVSFDTCPWDGLVTEQTYVHAGIAEWTCPLCGTTHQRDLR
jgi:transposase